PARTEKPARESHVGTAAGQIIDNEEVADLGNSGLSASELYNRGYAEMKKGKRELAYQCFKAARDSGERLDPVRTQRMNDYLRDLTPKANRSGIQLAGDQVESVTEPSPLDAAQQEMMVKFERVRADVLNSIFKAERLKETAPEKALELIDQTMAKV